MAGSANTSNFVLAAATIMIGEVGNLWNLNPTTASIGLVKNFVCTTTPTFATLTQGVKGQIVDSLMTANPIKVTMEAYEFTSANLAYSLGLDGSTLVPVSATYLLSTALTGNTTTPVTTATFVNATDVSATMPLGTWITIQDPNASDHVHVVQLSANTTTTGTAPTLTHTLTFATAGQGLTTGNNFPVDSVISVSNSLQVGSSSETPYLAAKVTAPLPNNNGLMSIMFPKIRIVKGFNLALNAEKYADLPMEWDPYDCVPTDPYYTEFSNCRARLFTNT